MGNSDPAALALVFVLVFGPAIALAIYGFRRGKRAFNDKLREVGSPLQARWQTLSESLRVAIIPALASLFGGIRVRTMQATGADSELAWQCVTAVGLIAVVFVIIPFMCGVQRAYRLAPSAKSLAQGNPEGQTTAPR